MKRIISTILATCLLFAVTACNNDNQPTNTTRTTESELKPGLSEPNQTIDTMSPDQTTETSGSTTAPTGKYTYTVYAGTEYETTLSMDVNIDDYLIDNDGEKVPFFSIGLLGDSLGWVDGESSLYSAYVYGDTQMVWRCGGSYSGSGSSDNPSGYPQLYSFNYHLAPSSNYKDAARSLEETNSSDLNCGIDVHFEQHSDAICYYTVGDTSAAGISRDDAIIIAYVFSSAITRPGENPFVGTNLEKAVTMRSDYYLVYVLP